MTAVVRRTVLAQPNGGWTQGWVAPEDREDCEPCGGLGVDMLDVALDCGACHGLGYWRRRVTK